MPADEFYIAVKKQVMENREKWLDNWKANFAQQAIHLVATIGKDDPRAVERELLQTGAVLAEIWEWLKLGR
ncbi:MAG: hypothetical protein AB1523_09720 [Bacillota bacterium]